jgi:hypothetical protein
MFMPDHKDPNREWKDIGGDLEASYDGARYVDIRHKSTKKRLLFISRGALQNAIDLFSPPPITE